MRLNHLPSEFQEALPILEKIKAAGYEAYFVGGSVRDALLHRPIHDVDIATSSYPEETKEIFERTVDVGIEHGTVLVLEDHHEYEITTFRVEEEYVDYRRPSQVNFVRSLEEDLKRRDFTVNAFALNEQSEIIDLFNGLEDLENKILRAVGLASERFNEDALRIMRGLRFAATLDFDIEEETFQAMKSHAPLLEKISIERSFIEFDKLLVAPHYRKGLQAMIASEVYRYLPELNHGSDAFQAILDDLNEQFVFSSSEQAWAYLILKLNIKKPTSFLKKWKTSNDFQKMVTNIVDVYRYRLNAELTKEIVYQYGKEIVQVSEELRQAEGKSVDFDLIDTLDDALTIHDKHEIVVNGGMLMQEMQLKPGPQLGLVIKKIEQAIVAGNLANEKEAIFQFVKKEL